MRWFAAACALVLAATLVHGLVNGKMSVARFGRAVPSTERPLLFWSLAVLYAVLAASGAYLACAGL